MKKNTKLVAEICLYGTNEVGFGWLARIKGRSGRLSDPTILGNGEPVQGRSFTECLFSACSHIADALISQGGMVRVFAPGGERMAETSLAHPGYYGDLKWTPAIQYVVSAEQILVAK